MDIQSYLDSGNLELYALGLLQGREKNEAEQNITTYPEIRAELEKIEQSLENLAASSAIVPPASVREKIINSISSQFPLINPNSDHQEWRRLVSSYIPEQFSEGRYSRVLQQTDRLEQMLLVSSTDFDDEIHVELRESFLILEGKCKCTVGDTEFFMEAGDYTEIPLHSVHRVEIITKPVVAVLQRLYP